MQSYVKMFFSFLDETDAMTDAEVGRLVRQIVEYARTGNIEKYLKGNERYVFPIYKTQIDRDRERYVAISQKRADAGRLGGQANASKCLQMQAKPSKSSQEKEEGEDKDKEKEKEEGEDISNNNSSSRGIPPISPTETVESYVAGNIDRMSAGNFEELIAFMEDLPKELIRYAVDECCANGKRTFGYLRSILQSYLRDNIRTVGEAKARSERHKATRVAMGTSGSVQKAKNPALDYAQRSYAEKDFSDLFVDLGG